MFTYEIGFLGMRQNRVWRSSFVFSYIKNTEFLSSLGQNCWTHERISSQATPSAPQTEHSWTIKRISLERRSKIYMARLLQFRGHLAVVAVWADFSAKVDKEV